MTFFKSIQFVKSATVKDSVILFSGTIFSTILGLLLVVILTRLLSLSEFGLIITALTFSLAVSDASELGINSSVFNFISGAGEKEKRGFLRVTFTSKLLISTFVSLMIFILSAYISKSVFNNLAMIPFIQISSLGIFLTILIIWAQTIFQAEKRFVSSVLTNISINLFRILAVVVISYLQFLSVINVYWAMTLILVIVLIALKGMIPISFTKIDLNMNDYKKVWAFSTPMGLGFLAWSVYTRLDQILVLNLKGANEAGVYGVAFRVASIIVFLAASFGVVITTRFASMDRGVFYTYFKKTLLVSLSLGLLSAVLIILAPLIIPLVFGKNFMGSIPPLQILTLASICFLISVPFNQAIIYQFKEPYFYMISSLFYLLLLYLLLTGLVPPYGSVGAAMSMLIMYFFQLLLSAGYFFYLQGKMDKQPVATA